MKNVYFMRLSEANLSKTCHNFDLSSNEKHSLSQSHYSSTLIHSMLSIIRLSHITCDVSDSKRTF
jgi:hypothetical protein